MTIQTPPSQTQAVGERIFSRVTPVIIALMVLFVIFNILTVVRDNTTRLNETYTSTLNRTVFALETEFEPYLRITRELATDSQMRNYISGEGGDINNATNEAKDLIRQNSAEFVGIRYLTLNNEVQFEVSNVGGVPIVTDPASADERHVITYDSEPIRNIASGSTQQIVVGELRELRDANGRPFNPPQTSLSLYHPIFANNGLLSAVLQVEVKPQTLLNVVNSAAQSIFDPVPGRSMVLLDRSSRIIADSQNPISTYLSDLSASNSNAGTNALYQTLVDFAERDVEGLAIWASGQVVSARHLDFAGATPVGWKIFIVDDFFTAYNASLISAGLTGVLMIVLGALAIAFLRRVLLPITDPIADLETRVRRLASGEVVAVAHSSAPPSEISQAVDTLSMRLKRLSSELSVQVRRRNRDMSVAGRIGRETATLSDLDQLLPRAINLICNELGFYHAQVFLVDESRTVATLRYSRGEAGQKMIEQGHRLRIGSPTVVGSVTADKRPVIINDTRAAQREGRHGFNPLLPETRAEMGLPLLIGDEIIGVLDIQSKEAGAFLVDDIPTYQLVADQLGIAIYNAQLQSQSERRYQQIDKLNKQLTRQAWETTEEKANLTDVYGTVADQSSVDQITAPISIRGEVIGALEAALPEGAFTDGDRMVLTAVAERVAIAIENARLFQETQSSLAETSTLYQLSQQLNESNTLDDVLHSIIVTVAPDAAGGQIWLFDDYLSGEHPEFVMLTVDLPLTERERIQPSAEQITLVMAAHPFLQTLKSDAVSLVADIRTAQDVDDTLRRLFSEQLKTLALAFVPLNMRGAWKGFLTINFGGTRLFGEREQRIYTALIGQAGVAIDNRLLLKQTEDALSRNEKLYAASRLINTTQNLEDLVLAAVATATSPHLNFWLALLEGEIDPRGWGDQARVIAKSNTGVAERTDEVHPLILPPDSPMRRREPAIIVDSGDDKHEVSAQIQWLRSLGLKFMAIFPLYSDNQPIALFYLVSEQAHELSPEDYEVYKALTGQMSTQIQNRRLLERTELALDETRRLFAAGSAIAAAQDTAAIYEAVARHLTLPYLSETLPLESRPVMSVTVLLARPEPTAEAPLLEYVHHWGSTADAAIPRIGDLIAHQDTPFAQLIRESDNDVLIYTDLTQDVMLTARMQEVLTQGNAASAAVAPLRSRQRWFGVIIIRSDQPRAFDENFGRFVQALAGQTAVAIERQLLLLETETERQNLNSILSTLPAGVLVLDPDTFVPVQINDRVRELLGQEIDYNQPFDAARYNLYRTGTNLFYPDDELPIYTARRQDRQMFADDVAVIFGTYQSDLLMNAAPIYDNRGQVLAIVTAFQDISNLRSLENTLQENLRETVSLYETQRALTQSESLDQLLDNILTQLAMQQPGDAVIVLTDLDDGSPYIARTLMQMIDTLEPFAPFLRSTVTTVEDVMTHHDVDDLTRNMLTPLGVRSMIVMPLVTKTRNRPLGWLILLDERDSVFGADQERMVTTLSDMATTAIDNNYLVQSTQKALKETETLYSAAASLSRSRDMSELSGAIERALLSLQPDMYFGYLTLAPESGKMTELFRQHTEPLDAANVSWETVINSELTNRDGLFVTDMAQADDHPLTAELARSGVVKAFAAVNLRVKDIPSGRIIVAYHEPQRFSQGNIQLLSTISDSASVVIDNQLLLEQIQSTLQETSVLYQASRALIEVQSPDDIIDVIINYLIEPHINQVFIAMLSTSSWDTTSASVEVVSSWQSETDVDLLGVTLSPDQFPAWRQLSSETVLTINDIYDSQYGLNALEQTSIESLDTRSLVIVPLRVSSRAIGAIWLGSREVYAYSDQNLRIFQAFAEQTSLSLEASRLLEQTERRARQLETSATISQRVSQILDLDVLLPQVVELIRDQFGYDHVQVFLMDDQDNYAVLRASTGEAGRQLLGINHRLKKGSDSVIGRVTSQGMPALALDTADANVVHQPNPYLPLTRSEMALPLMIKGEIVGALDVQSNQPNAFIDDDIQVLTTLAAQISVAIDNARLYVDSLRRANEMSFLFDVTSSAAAAEKLDESLQAVTVRVTETLQPLAMVIYLPIIYEDYEQNQIMVMRAAALAGIEQPLSEISEVRVGDAENLVGLVAGTLQSTIVSDISRDVRYLSVAPTAKSAVVVPINSGSELIGVIAVEDVRLNAYNHDSLTLLLTLSGSLAATIQNRKLVETLQATNEQLREVDRLKSQFLASMSHELRTPLNSIIGFSRVMLKGIDGDLTEMQEQDLTTIYNSGNHLLNLINDILDQAKIEANELNLKFGYFDVKPMVESVKSIAVGLVKEKLIRLNVDIAPNMPQAYGDEFRSRQILLNLVSNAIKFTPEGSVTIHAYATEGRHGIPVIRLDVQDTGIGIADNDMSKLFERFRQVDSSLTRTVGGTGLGLAISKSLAELQGGEIAVSSEINVGSVFSVIIPTDTAAEEALKTKREAAEKKNSLPTPKPTSSNGDTGIMKKTSTKTDPPHAPGSDTNRPPGLLTREVPSILNTRREVMLIEDNKDMVDQYRRALQREGFEVQTADHPAYARAMAGQLRPNVLILDVNFGNGQGWDILKDLKEADETYDIPVVICTLDSDSERAYRLGAHTFLQRPILPDALVEGVKKAEIESRRERILIIDDQPDTIRLIKQLLDEHGNYRVFSAENGKDGIALVARRHPDLVILDLRMPDMDGFTVLQELRANPETANIPVLVVTGDTDLKEDEQELLRNIRVVPKTDISQEEFEQFLEDVKKHLTNNGNKR